MACWSCIPPFLGLIKPPSLPSPPPTNTPFFDSLTFSFCQSSPLNYNYVPLSLSLTFSLPPPGSHHPGHNQDDHIHISINDTLSEKLKLDLAKKRVCDANTYMYVVFGVWTYDYII